MPTYKIVLDGGLEFKTDYTPAINRDYFYLYIKSRSTVRYSGHNLFLLQESCPINIPLKVITFITMLKRTQDQATGDITEIWDECWQRPQGEFEEWKYKALSGFERLFQRRMQPRNPHEEEAQGSVPATPQAMGMRNVSNPGLGGILQGIEILEQDMQRVVSAPPTTSRLRPRRETRETQ